MSDAILHYKGETIHVRDVKVSLTPKEDYSGFTNAQLEEAARLGDEIIKLWMQDEVGAFLKLHPNGGTFFFLPDGSVGFQDYKVANSN